ncbi:P-loop containing nucleoside triphosphate hydrolase protein [Daedaleopsis nitida]|nr:P-loop containing nucleoside triphosphate hydrolase protein [Daedaleopsis nitida]
MDAVAVLQTVLTAIQSGSVALNGSAVFATNATAQPVTTLISPLSILQLPTLIAHLLSLSAVRDWLKLLLIGAALESCRRFLTSSWTTVKNYFWITVTLDEGDDCGYWLMYWLSRHQVFRTARTLDVSSRHFGMDAPVLSESSGVDDTGKGRNISFLPSLDTTYTLWYKYRYVTVTRHQTNDGPWQTKQTLQIRMLTRNHELLRDLLVEAKKQYLSASQNMISVYVSSSHSDYWKLMCTQHKRPMKSIILDPGVIDLVINDAKDFLASKEWYAERGIPHRRGYLLYGAPGAGKTSLIHSIAGELELDVYILSLTRLGMDDATLNSIIADLPDKCIVLIEDVDAAFHQGIKRDIVDPEKQRADDKDKPPQPEKDNSESISRITLSGLLNALDGIGAQEGRILFATTNDYTALDPALCRPGRLDLHIEFKLASKYQCRELYRRFYLPSGAADDKEQYDEADDASEKDSGYGSRTDTPLSSTLSPTSASSFSSSSCSADGAGSCSSDTSATYVGIAHSTRAPKLSRRKAAELADRFAALLPNRAFSMATLQGYLMTYKSRPYDAVDELPTWIARKLRENKGGTRSDAPLAESEVAAVAVPATSAASPAPSSSPSSSSSPADATTSSGEEKKVEKVDVAVDASSCALSEGSVAAPA